MLKKVLTVLTFLCAVAAWAGPSAIDKEIETIMKAPPGERVELMNAFKRRLFEMNQQERAMAIRRLRGSMAPRRGTPGAAGMPLHPPRQGERGPANARAPQRDVPRRGDGAPLPPPAAPGAGQGERPAPPAGASGPGAGRKSPPGGGMGRGGPHR